MIQYIVLVFCITSIIVSCFSIFWGWLIIIIPSLYLLITLFSIKQRKYSYVPELSFEANKLLQKFGNYYSKPYAGRAYSASSSMLFLNSIILSVINIYKGWWSSIILCIIYCIIMGLTARHYNPTLFFFNDLEKSAHEEIISFIQNGILLMMLALSNYLLGIDPFDMIRAVDSNTYTNYMSLPIFQSLLGLNCINLHTKYSALVSKRIPEKKIFSFIEQIIHSINKSELKEGGDMIEFVTKYKRYHFIPFYNNTSQWKAQLFHELGVFIMKKGDDIIFTSKEDVDITSKGKSFFNDGFLNISIKLSNIKLSGKIRTDSLAIFGNWKTSTN